MRNHVVTVTGDPYCIIPASASDQYQAGTTESTYNASANFGIETFSYYHWSGTADISLENNETVFASVNAEGAAPAGDGDVKCTVYAFSTGTPYTGDLPVTVCQQFQYNYPDPATTVIATAGPNGVYTQLSYVQFSKTISVGVVEKGAVDFTIGGSSGGSAGGSAGAMSAQEQSDASASLGLTLGVQYSSGSSETYTAGGATQAGWLAIGPELTALKGSVVVSTPDGGPQPPTTSYKLTPLSSGAPSAYFTGGPKGKGLPLVGYSDPNESGLFIVGG